MEFPSPAGGYVKSRIDLNKICNCPGPASRRALPWEAY